MMGMLLPDDEKYLWIAEESLFAHLPEGTVVRYGVSIVFNDVT